MCIRDRNGGGYELYLSVESLDEPDGEQRIRDRFHQALAVLPDIPHSHDRLGFQGDANFDGAVDARDFQAWHSNRFSVGSGPESGDFNGDGWVDVRDFNVWNQHAFRESVPAATARRAAPAAPAAASLPAASISTSVDELPVVVVAPGPCLLYTSPSPRDATLSRMPSSA